MTTLQTAELQVVGRVMPASNHTYLCQLGDDAQRVIYKPVAGERPLWDFPDGTLAEREYAAWLVSEALGWGIVPRTILRDGPAGFGMVQEWIDTDPGQHPVDVVRAGSLPDGHVHVLWAEDADGETVQLTHEDSEPLFRMAVFDVLTNNTDRKGGHILAGPDGVRFGVDHGICFHEDDKLRTVLWGFAGRTLPESMVVTVRAAVENPTLLEALEEHLSMPEVAAFVTRGRLLAGRGTMPDLAPGWPAIPWPPF